jgi:hypothetical protein
MTPPKKAKSKKGLRNLPKPKQKELRREHSRNVLGGVSNIMKTKHDT